MLCLATGYLVPGTFAGPLGALTLCSVCLAHSVSLLGTIPKLVLGPDVLCLPPRKDEPASSDTSNHGSKISAKLYAG